MSEEELHKIAGFIETYAVCLLGSGVHTSRVNRNSQRIAESQGVNMSMMTFQRTVVMTVVEAAGTPVATDQSTPTKATITQNATAKAISPTQSTTRTTAEANATASTDTRVINIPTSSVSFALNSDLSALSWRAIDRHLSLDELWEEYNRIIAKPRINNWQVLTLAGLANASFCKLFGGDWISMIIVFIATVSGLFIKQELQKKEVNHLIATLISAFIAASLAAFACYFDTTAEIAMATSILFLIPGVPLINGIIDVVEGYTLIGFSRLVQAFLLIIFIAVGLSAALLLFKHSLL
ncbi:MAG: threonine/serine exporter family protein [Bacteroidales bacterium]|jgi:uncharacterized membrane protein YjjP (DUF1212 family)|nr:threonine/serine exporter family protein [Bacteroidales bacterium]